MEHQLMTTRYPWAPFTPTWCPKRTKSKLYSKGRSSSCLRLTPKAPTSSTSAWLFTRTAESSSLEMPSCQLRTSQI
jgi:hypothetical protein